MFQNLEVFSISTAMARHAGQKQAVVAQNIANADTPGYGAWDLPDFRDFHQKPDHSAVQRASRSRHLNGTMADAARALPIAVQDVAAPNGNSVSIETEMLKGVEAQRQHSRALAIYKSALGVLRSTIKT
jgi:flagellar basal-body rod protein FlgB